MTGSQILLARRKTSVTQAELAASAGLYVETIRDLENEKCDPLHPELVERMIRHIEQVAESKREEVSVAA